jgi:hypothetical protein
VILLISASQVAGIIDVTHLTQPGLPLLTSKSYYRVLWGGVGAQIMYTHASKCKNDKIKFFK